MMPLRYVQLVRVMVLMHVEIVDADADGGYCDDNVSQRWDSNLRPWSVVSARVTTTPRDIIRLP